MMYVPITLSADPARKLFRGSNESQRNSEPSSALCSQFSHISDSVGVRGLQV